MASNPEWRQWLVESHHTASRDFDKAVMTLAGGGLALSITFVHDFAPHARHHVWLGVGWALLAASLVAILLSHLASQKSILDEVARVDNAAEGTSHDYWGGSTDFLNWLSAGCLVGGVICLVVFALYNARPSSAATPSPAHAAASVVDSSHSRGVEA